MAEIKVTNLPVVTTAPGIDDTMLVIVDGAAKRLRIPDLPVPAAVEQNLVVTANALANKLDRAGDISQTSGNIAPSRIPFTSGPANGMTLEQAVADIYARIQGGGSTEPVVNVALSVSFPGGTADVGETATITPCTYTSGTVLSRSFNINVNGAIVLNTAATTFTVPAGADQGQRALSVTELAVWANGVKTTTSVTYIVNAPAQVTTPVALTLPTISGTNAADTSTLTGSHGTYGNGAVLSYTYRWLRDGVAIGGATALTYAKTSADWGRIITFEETPTNAVGAGAANTSAALAVLAGSGVTYLLFDAAALAATQARVTSASGQWKNAGDAYAGSIGEWARVQTSANTAGLESNTETISTDNHGVYNYYGTRTRDRAFSWLVTGNTSHRDTAITELLAILANANHDISSYNFNPGFYRDGMVSQSTFGLRMALTYAMLKPAMSGGQQTTAEAKFTNWADHLNTWFNSAPNVTPLFLASGGQGYQISLAEAGPTGVWEVGDPSGYCYLSSAGALTDRISKLSSDFNNRTSGTLGLLGVLGVLLGSTTYKTTATGYFTKLLQYGVWTDGATTDYMRNGDYGASAQGRNYSSIVIMAFGLYAEAARLAGDTGIYALTTTGGRDGTEGATAKTLSLCISEYLKLIRSEKSWYSGHLGASGARTAATHLGKQIITSNFGTLHSWHDYGFQAFRAGLPSLASTINSTVHRDPTVFTAASVTLPGFEGVPGTAGFSAEYGTATPGTDCLGVYPAPSLMFATDIASGGGGGAAAPTIEGTATTQTAGGTSPTINKPTTGVTVAVGDWLYLITSVDGTVGATGPSGFTQLGATLLTSWTDQQAVSVWRRKATSADVAASSYSYAASNANNVGIMFVARGANATEPNANGLVSAADVNSNVLGYATPVAVAAPTATAPVANTRVIRVLGVEVDTSGTATYGTASPAQTVHATADNGSFSSLRVTSATQDASGATGVVSASCSFTGGGKAAGIGLTFCIAP